MTVAFYAPLKSPDDPVPSGDREMARLLFAALGRAGYQPALASRLRSFNRSGDPDLALTHEAHAAAAIQILLHKYQTAPPRLWFTYHVYYKAPDLIGPTIAQRLGIPYVVAEGSRSPRRAEGPWARGHARAEAALDAADDILILNEKDRPALEAVRPDGQRLHAFPPFIDPDGWPVSVPRERGPVPRLLAVAMMRAGDKMASYGLLARALTLAADLPWTLDIVGDGNGRAQVEAMFAGLGERVRWHGEVADRGLLGGLYTGADLLVWPAVNEAFGMVFLEAGLHGCPSLAGDFGGVRGVVLHDETGVVVPPGNAQAFASGLRDLLLASGRLPVLGEGARRLAHGSRTIAAASVRLREILGARGLS